MRERAAAIVDAATTRCYTLCEMCGNEGRRRNSSGWLHVACDATRQRDEDVNEEAFAVLTAYTRGQLSRGQAMATFSLDWYGDLLRLLRGVGLKVQQSSSEDLATMDACIAQVFSGAMSCTQETNG